MVPNQRHFWSQFDGSSIMSGGPGVLAQEHAGIAGVNPRGCEGRVEGQSAFEMLQRGGGIFAVQEDSADLIMGAQIVGVEFEHPAITMQCGAVKALMGEETAELKMMQGIFR